MSRLTRFVTRGAGVTATLAALAFVSGCDLSGLTEGELELDEPSFDVELPEGWKEPSPAFKERAERYTMDLVDRAEGKLGQEFAPVGYEFLGITPRLPTRLTATAEVSFEPVTDDISVEEYATQVQEIAGRVGQPPTGVERYETSDLDGDETVSHVYEQTYAGLESTWLSVTTIHDGDTGVTVNFAAPPGGLGSYEDDFNEIIENWEWTD